MLTTPSRTVLFIIFVVIFNMGGALMMMLSFGEISASIVSCIFFLLLFLFAAYILDRKKENKTKLKEVTKIEQIN